MKDEIKAKLDEHIKCLLGKPTLSTEEYDLLKMRLYELPKDTSPDWAFILLMLIFSGIGGDKNGL